MFEAKKSPLQLRAKDEREDGRTPHHTLNDSPAMVSQRQRLDDAFGSQLQLKSKSPMPASVSGGGPVLQRVTKITHTAGIVDLGTRGKPTVGKKMEAQLDVADPVIGTATGAQWQWTRDLRRMYPQAGVVRGHLLNHDLGGNAIPSNLYPISTKANSAHSSQVEQPVKKLLNQAEVDVRSGHAGNLVKDDANHYVHYEVKVGETKANDPQKASFDCAFKVGPTGVATHVSVPSNLGTDKDRYNASAGLIPGQAKVPPHPQWAHTGKWMPTSNYDASKINEVLNGHSADIPALASGGQPNYSVTLDAMWFIYGTQMRKISYTNKFASYSLGQDKVRKFLLLVPAFQDDLADFAAANDKSTKLPQFLADLKEAVKTAAKSVPPTALPKSAWTWELKTAYSIIHGKGNANEKLVYEAVKALRPNVHQKSIEKYLDANHNVTLSTLAMRKSLKKLAGVYLISQVGKASWDLGPAVKYVKG